MNVGMKSSISLLESLGVRPFSRANTFVNGENPTLQPIARRLDEQKSFMKYGCFFIIEGGLAQFNLDEGKSNGLYFLSTPS